MNTLLVLLVATSAVKTQDIFIKWGASALTECKIDTGLPRNEVDEIFNKLDMSTRNKRCFLACFFEKLKLVSKRNVCKNR